jgi:nucleotide-binding universal stress UspA family protein
MSNDRLTLLVPVDFSETSRRALAWAFDYAARAPCDVHLLHVIEDHFFDLLEGREIQGVAAELARISADAAAELERMVPDAEERERIGRIQRHVARGHAAPEILRLAEKLGADLIVMGTHGRSGIAKLLVGSVAEKIVRRAACTVVCVKPTV